MPRVSALEVSKIFSVTTVSDLDTFIDTAHLIVSEELGSAGLSAERLKQIELYLSAHFAVICKEKGGLGQQEIGDAEERYKTPDDSTRGFESTRYGQQAISLDSTGTLGALTAAPVKAQFRVV